MCLLEILIIWPFFTFAVLGFLCFLFYRGVISIKMIFQKFYRLLLVLIYFSIGALIASLASIFLLLLTGISDAFILYINLNITLITPLVLEYFSEHLKYRSAKRADSKRNIDLQGDVGWWIDYFFLSNLYEIPKNLSVRFAVYCVAIIILFISTYFYFEIGELNTYHVDVFYRVIITFIAAERTLKYAQDKWLKNEKNITELKEKRKKCPIEFFDEFTEKKKKEKDDSDVL